MGVYAITKLKKTYNANRIPDQAWSECLLDPVPTGPAWRDTCGTQKECRDCPWRPALNVDKLEIESGRIVGILGHNGSGKTTLMNVLALLHEPDPDTGGFEMRFEGQELRFRNGAWFNGNDRTIDGNRIRGERFGFAFQDAFLNSNHTARQNIVMAMGLRGDSPAEMEAKRKMLLQELDFPEDRLGAFPTNLSGGQKQRVSIVRALAKDPEVLFLDEPTGNLDVDGISRLMNYLVRWKNAGQRTIIMVIHDHALALEYCDDLLVLENGRLAMAPEELRGLDREERTRALRKVTKRYYEKDIE